LEKYFILKNSEENKIVGVGGGSGDGRRIVVYLAVECGARSD
jgi:hypothetical protein